MNRLHRKYNRLYLSTFSVLVIFAFLHVINLSSSPPRPLLQVAYDEYNCGCPRYGPAIEENGTVSLCSDWSSSRGKGQNVISYSIFGDSKDPIISIQYYEGIEDRLKEASIYYDSWIVRLYHNATEKDDVTNQLICKLYCSYPNFDPCQIRKIYMPDNWNNTPTLVENAYKRIEMKLVNYVYSKFLPFTSNGETKTFNNKSVRPPMANQVTVPDQNETSDSQSNSFANLLIGKMWRFLPMADDLVDNFLIRDVDSYILPREVAAVSQWQLNSTALIHCMRDHPSHNGFILAGLWGGSRSRDEKKMTRIFKEMLKWPPHETWDYDQIILLRVVWPQVLDNVLVHDSYHCENPFLKSRSKTLPFPTKRNGRLFVGWGPTRSTSEISLIRPCPKKCRPKEHADWKLC